MDDDEYRAALQEQLGKDLGRAVFCRTRSKSAMSGIILLTVIAFSVWAWRSEIAGFILRNAPEAANG